MTITPVSELNKTPEGPFSEAFTVLVTIGVTQLGAKKGVEMGDNEGVELNAMEMESIGAGVLVGVGELEHVCVGVGEAKGVAMMEGDGLGENVESTNTPEEQI